MILFLKAQSNCKARDCRCWSAATAQRTFGEIIAELQKEFGKTDPEKIRADIACFSSSCSGKESWIIEKLGNCVIGKLISRGAASPLPRIINYSITKFPITQCFPILLRLSLKSRTAALCTACTARIHCSWRARLRSFPLPSGPASFNRRASWECCTRISRAESRWREPIWLN